LSMVCADAVPAKTRPVVTSSAAMDRFISPPMEFRFLSRRIMHCSGGRA
jgi:hypothetical protein